MIRVPGHVSGVPGHVIGVPGHVSGVPGHVVYSKEKENEATTIEKTTMLKENEP